MEKNTSIWKHTLTNGVILGLVLIIYTVLLYITNLTFNLSLGLLSYVIIIGGIFLGTKSYRDKVLDGAITYGNALVVGILIAVFAGILSALFSYILTTWIDPGMVEKGFKVMEEKFLSRGMSEDQVEMIMNRARENASTIKTLLYGIIGSAVIGTIISLITAAILKKEKNPLMEGTE
jgi:hypothetical protein